MGFFDDVTGAKGYHLYSDNAVKGFKGVSLGTGVLNDLFGPKSDYVLEIWSVSKSGAAVLQRAIIFPLHPEAIDIIRPAPTLITYTFGAVPTIEHSMHRNLTLRLEGRSGLASRSAHNREGNTVFKPGPELLREFDAFLDFYQTHAVRSQDRFKHPLASTSGSGAYLVFRSFAEHIHVRVEPKLWKMSKNARNSRFSYRYELELTAYAPATPEKPSRLFGKAQDALQFIGAAADAGTSFVAMGANALSATNTLLNSVRGPVQALGRMAGAFNRISGEIRNIGNFPRLFVQDLSHIASQSRNAISRLSSNLDNGYGSVAQGVVEEWRNLGDILDHNEDLARNAAALFGALGAQSLDLGLLPLGDELPPGGDPGQSPANPTGPAHENYSTPGEEVQPPLPPLDELGIWVILSEGETIQSLALRYLGDAAGWMAIVQANKMISPYYKAGGEPLKAGDKILVPNENPFLSAAQLSPTQNMLTDRFGTDLYVNPQTGDLEIIDDDATDIRKVNDKENLEQAIRHRLLTRQGECSYWPGYGLPLLIGQKVSAKTLGYVAAHLNGQLLRDPRIVELAEMKLSDEGDGLTGYLEVTPVAGNNVSVISPI